MVARTRRSKAPKAEEFDIENDGDDGDTDNIFFSSSVDCHEPDTRKIEGRIGSTKTAKGKVMHAASQVLDDNLLETIAGIFLKRKDDNNKNSGDKLGVQKSSVGALTWRPNEVANSPGTLKDTKRVHNTIDIKHGARCKSVPHPDRKTSQPDRPSKSWFELPTQDITEEVKTDLRVLRLRSTFDPKQFYKRFDDTKFPKQFHFGTVVEPASDFFSARLSKTQRKRTLAEEVLHDPYLSSVRKKRYNRIQDEAWYRSSKGHARKTEKPRLKKKPRKPKH
jgi:hypothetical protein